MEHHAIVYDHGLYLIDGRFYVNGAQPDSRIVAAVEALRAEHVRGLLRVDGERVEWVRVTAGREGEQT